MARFSIRMADDLFDRLTSAAADENRSLAAEVELRVRRSFQAEDEFKRLQNERDERERELLEMLRQLSDQLSRLKRGNGGNGEGNNR